MIGPARPGMEAGEPARSDSEGGDPVRNPAEEGGPVARDELDVPDLIARAKLGDTAAFNQLMERFGGEVRMMVRGRLPKMLRGQFDSMDFVQAVWQSFFVDLKDGSPDFENARHLRKFLEGMARNKVFEQHRRLTKTEKYAVKREERLYVRRGEREVERELVARGPTPSEAAQAGERLAQLTSGCSPREVEVITLRYQGLTLDEIASRTGMCERSARRIIDAARARMEARGWQ
jgi:RNA polymerase sigma-70 factor (ECF subfamily)